MDPKPTPFNSDAPLGDRRVIVRRNPSDGREVELVEATWGSDPRFGAGGSYRFIRSEGRSFPNHRCLIAASEFHIAAGAKRYRVALDGGDFFYLAGIWDPAVAGWPLSYRIVTVPANREVARHQDRHGAIIPRRQVMQWLDLTVPESELLATPPDRTFLVEEIGAGQQATLAF
ncbi:SOS response-associated peptidase family protein [Sphingomonas faeni]|uniref:SOS response-associated peptidase family protein n=1 Tax=Sphingomonas faeni TaxID=185950 RepID=UPI00334FC4EF